MESSKLQSGTVPSRLGYGFGYEFTGQMNSCQVDIFSLPAPFDYIFTLISKQGVSICTSAILYIWYKIDRFVSSLSLRSKGSSRTSSHSLAQANMDSKQFREAAASAIDESTVSLFLRDN